MFLVSVPRIFKIALRVSCGETTIKVACEISAFYNFAENSITLSLLYLKVKFMFIFEDVVKIFWKNSVIELLFSKFQAYKLHYLALHVFKILGNSWDNVCCGIPFYRSRCIQVLHRIAALNSFFRSSQGYLKRTSTWMFYWEVAQNILSGYFFQNANGCALHLIHLSRTPMDAFE